MMAEEPPTATGDIENPQPATATPTEETSPNTNATNGNVANSGRKNWKVISLGVVVLAAVAVAIALGVTLGGDNASTSSSANSNNAAEPTTTKPATTTKPGQVSKATQYLDSVGPIETRVRIIDPSVVNGYNSCNDLKDDILNALNHYVSTIIAQEIQYNVDAEKCDPNDPNNWWNQPPVEVYPYSGGFAEDAAAEAPASESGSSGTVAMKVTEDSFGTNNQVEGVDEADVVKSDGEYVFAAYGDLLYVWNATDGTAGVSITAMPYEKVDLSNCYSGTWEPMPVDDVAVAEEASNSTSSEAANATLSDVSSSNSTASDTNANENGEIIRSRKATSIMPGYWPCYQPKPSILSLLLQGKRLTAIVSESSYMPMEKETSEPRVMSDSSKLIVRVYDISNIPTDGSALTLLGERVLNGTSYNSARSVNDTAIIFATSYFDTYQLSSDLYRYNRQYCGLNDTEYEALAVKTALNKTERFAERMLEELQVQVDGKCDSIFQVAAMQSGNTTDAFGGNLLGSFVQVISFDASSDFVDKKISTNIAGGFSSGWISSIYATQDFAATLSVGSTYNATTNYWDQATFILGFDISTPIPKPFSYAEIPGSPLNQYSADLYEGHLRVVTTEWFWSDATSTSTTTNKIFVLKVPKSGEGSTMTLTGETDHVGKPNESIMSVRFMGDKGYVVTYLRKDPFYVYDLSNPSKPKKMGELEIPGYSSYLHPIEIDGVPLMLGIGMNVNETTGWETGVKISLFDVTDPTTLRVNATYVDEGAYSSAGYDFLSFRYLPLSQKLIIPKSEYTGTANNNFDGFVVYDIGFGKVKPSYEIQHASSYDMYYGCWYGAYMPARSFVFKSKLTTILSHTAISTDLETGDRLWNLTLDVKNNTDCRPYFLY